MAPKQIDIDMSGAKQFAGIGNGFPFGMLIASIIVIVAASIACSEPDNSDTCDNEGELFALVGGIILFVLTIFYMCLSHTNSIGANLDVVFVVIFFIFWGVYAGYTTFENPFFIPGNGYFAAWLGFFCSAGLLVYTVKEANSLREKFLHQGLPLSFLITGSIIVIIAGVAGGCCNNEDILAIIAGAVSLLACVFRILLADRIDSGFFAVFMLGWWLILGLIITFSVFEFVSNGFFATWVCLASSIYLCFPHKV